MNKLNLINKFIFLFKHRGFILNVFFFLVVLTFLSPSFPLVFSNPVSQPLLIRFEDVTEKAGLRFRHNNGAFGMKYLPETMGSGLAFLDYNNDEPQNPKTPEIWKNILNGFWNDIFDL